MIRLLLMVAPFIAFAGCRTPTPGYSPDGTSGGPCMISAECAGEPNTPVCDMSETPHMCEHCTTEDHQLCTGNTPLCENHSCVACNKDPDCGIGGLCLPNGACATSDNVIHAVSINGSIASNCGGPGVTACTLSVAFANVIATKNVIKLDDAGPYSPDLVGPNGFIAGSDLTLDARGASLHTKGADGPILSILDNKTVTIFGGVFQTATGNNGDGILCGSSAMLAVDGTTIDMSDKSAINALSGCKLIVTNATLSNNSKKGGVYVASILDNGDSVTLSRSRILSNKGGGINVESGTFVIVGNVFQGNGDMNNSSLGGVLINTQPDPMNRNRMEFNSISGNHAQGGPGVNCTAGAGFVVRNNIIWGNMPNPQVNGTCKHAYSDIEMLNMIGTNDGGNNLSIDPMFGPTDLHLKSTSMVLKKADPNASLDGIAAKDIDGDPRIAPADMGADQLPRP